MKKHNYLLITLSLITFFALGLCANSQAQSTSRLAIDKPASGTGVVLNNETGGNMIFSISGSEKMRLDNLGRLGIGTTSPADVLSLGLNQLNFNPTTTIGSFTDAAAVKALGDIIIDFDNNANDANSVFAITHDNGTNEVFRIEQDGSVGIGTANLDPYSKLHIWKGSAGTIDANTNAIATFENSTNGYLQLLVPNTSESGILFGNPASSASGGIIYDNAKALHFRTNNNITQMLIDAGGNVGIGTAIPHSKLEVAGDLTLINQSGSAILRLKNNTASDVLQADYNSLIHTGGDLYIRSGSNLIINDSGGGNVSIGTTNSQGYELYVAGKIASTNGIMYGSDARYKKNIKTINSNTVAKLSQVRGTTYKFRTKNFKKKKFSTKSQMGFIAQELIKVYPELVTKGNDGYYSVNYTGLIPVLVEAVKDLRKKNGQLEGAGQDMKAKVSKLERKNQLLEARMAALEKLLIKAKK